MTDLVFPDAQGLADLGTYAVRAKSVDETGAMRLQARGTTLAAYVGVLPGLGLMAEGAVIGLRVMALAEPARLDATVPLGAVTDRIARAGEPRVFPVPPTRVRAAWAALSPPRAGWERVGTVPAEAVLDAAREGIEAIAHGTPEGSGGQAVAALRTRTWSRGTRTTPPFPMGGAWAAYALGFGVPGTMVEVFAHGRWTRLSTPAGHVLLR